MMIHNIVKYLVQTRLHLWDIKITNFKPESCPHDSLEICYSYISQINSILHKIFYKIVYHRIIYMCDFFGKRRWLFGHGLHRFSRRLWFAPDMFPYCKPAVITFIFLFLYSNFFLYIYSLRPWKNQFLGYVPVKLFKVWLTLSKRVTTSII